MRIVGKLACGVVPFSTFSMKRKRKPYSIFQQGSSVFMILALLWLTISAPFVIAGQQKMAKMERICSDSCPLADSEEETANPFGNTTEEKSPNSTNFSEEFLHDHHSSEYSFSIALQYHKCENAGTYVAFHGELLVPPPNVA